MKQPDFPDTIPTDCPKKALRHIVCSFTEHPAIVGESYWQHFVFTTGMALRMTLTGMALFLHGFFPFICCRTASHQIEKIHKTLRERTALRESLRPEN